MDIRWLVLRVGPGIVVFFLVRSCSVLPSGFVLMIVSWMVAIYTLLVFRDELQSRMPGNAHLRLRPTSVLLRPTNESE